MVAEKFQNLGVKIPGKYICELKSRICLFLLITHVHKQNFSEILIITTSSNYPFSPNNVFFKLYFFPAEWGKDYEAEKMTKIKL